MHPYFDLLRYKHCIKNILIFFPLFFAGGLFDAEALLGSAIAFISFSLASSAMYVTNDILDAQFDRNHPAKKQRPIAAGLVKPGVAAFFAAFLAVFSVIIAALLNLNVFAVVGAYIILNFLYSILLKNIPVLDILSVAIGFPLRLYAGAFAADVALTNQFVIMTFLLAVLLTVGKRRDDTILLEKQALVVRPSVKKYNTTMLNSMIIVIMAAVIASYIIYTISPEILMRPYGNSVYLTTIFVVAGMMRYLQIIFVEGGAASPTELILRDRFMQITTALCGSAFAA